MVKQKHIFIFFILISLVFALPIFSQTSGQGTVQVDALVPAGEEPEEEEPSPGGVAIIIDTVFPLISEIEITNISLDSVRIIWKTNELCIPQINYGKTKDYTKTYIGASFSLENSIFLENLLSDTVYHFEIVAIDRAGNRTSSEDRTFKTLPPEDIFPPANISYFEAVAADSQITLKWQNPPDPDFEAVKITRSENFYPSNPEQGITIYDGKNSPFIDTGLTNEKRYYYTAFTYDGAGNYSSGAIISAIPFLEIPPELPPEIPPEVPPEEVPPEIDKLTIEDFEFFQEGQKLQITEKGAVDIGCLQPVTISIPYEKVPEVLKTIMITLKKGEKSFSFLLRVSQDKTFYEAKIMPPEVGLYPLTFTILDYKNQTLKKISGKLEVVEVGLQQTSIPWYEQIITLPYIIYILLIILFLIILIVILFIRRKTKARDINKLQNTKHKQIK